jgi:iron(III) transport system substrate-binding protein
MKSCRLPLTVLVLLAFGAPVVSAQEKTLNLYSARHYQTDEALYANFTRQTGIKINRIEAKEDELLERIRKAPTARPTSSLPSTRHAWPRQTNWACSPR